MLKQANLSFSVAAQSFGDDVTSIQFSTQDKNTAKLIFIIKEGKQPLNLTDVEGKVDLVMGDKSVFDDNVATVTAPLDGKLEYTITADQIRHPGRARGELQLISKDGQSIGGFRFNFTIKKALVDEYARPVKEYYVQDLEAIKAEIRKTADSIKDLDVVRIDSKLNELEQKVEEGGVGVDEQARQKIEEVTEQLVDTGKDLRVTGSKIQLTKADGSPLGNGVEIPTVGIDDAQTSTSKVWSSQKVQQQIQAIPKGEKGDKGDPGTASTAIDDSLLNTSQTWSSKMIQDMMKETTSFLNQSTNLFNKNDIVENARLASTSGELDFSTTSFSVSGLIPIIPNTVFTGNNVSRKAFYSKNKSFVSSDTVNGTFTTPANAYFIKIQFTKGLQTTTQLNIGGALLPYEEYRRELKSDVGVTLRNNSVGSAHLKDKIITPEKTDFIIKSANLFNKNTAVKGKVVGSDGSITDNANYAHSDFIPVTELRKYTMTPIASVPCYDNNKNFISRLSGVGANTNLTITPPSGAAFIRVNINLNASYVSLDTVQVNEGEGLLPYENFGYSLSEKINVKGTNVGGGGNEGSPIDHFVINGKLDGYYQQQTVLPARTYMLHDVIYSFYDSLKADFPNYITKSQIGSSVNGLPIYKYEFNPPSVDSPETKFPTLLLLSGTHGPEKMAVDVLKHTLTEITRNWKSDELLETLRWNARFIVIPLVNPDGWDAHDRKNAHGIDINRQFPAGWYQESPDSNDYGGTAPLTEPEAIALKSVIDSEKDNLIYACDFHNFSTKTTEETKHQFIWNAGATLFNINLAKSLIRTVSQKWKRKHSFFPQNDTTMFGYSSYTPGGSIAYYCASLGVQASTYECSQAITAYKPDDGNYGSMAMGLFTEAYINWLILNLRNNILH